MKSELESATEIIRIIQEEYSVMIQVWVISTSKKKLIPHLNPGSGVEHQYTMLWRTKDWLNVTRNQLLITNGCCDVLAKLNGTTDSNQRDIKRKLHPGPRKILQRNMLNRIASPGPVIYSSSHWRASKFQKPLHRKSTNFHPNVFRRLKHLKNCYLQLNGQR